jgi:cellulose synthase/poly-beta-1,6-N-acetylglucosamine synthase-like glycosyltransferase
MLIILFWTLFCCIVYTYFGYPIFLSLIAKIGVKNFGKEDIFPCVSLIIGAYNEEKSIEQKINNSLALNYPKEKLEIIVSSDCSTDKTNEIVKRFASSNVRLFIAEKRSGKTAGRNIVIPEAKGEIVVLSDATGMYEKDALRKLVRNFSDPRVGCVGGILKYVNNSNSMVGSGEGLYWRYEVMLRRKESLLGNLMAVSGSIYAFRKELYSKIPEELADDLIMPLTIKKSGYYAIFEPEAICIEETAKDDKEESAKRIRIANRNIMGLIYMKELFNFFKYGIFSFELFSHKVLRLLIPFFLIALFIITCALSKTTFFYFSFALLQIIFYGVAAVGYVIQKRFKKKNRFFYIPLFFCVTNIGVFLGIIKYLNGQKKAIWEPVR